MQGEKIVNETAACCKTKAAGTNCVSSYKNHWRKKERKGKGRKKKKGYSRIRPCNKNYRLRLQWLCGGIAKDTPPISQRRFAHSPKLSDFSFSEG